MEEILLLPPVQMDLIMQGTCQLSNFFGLASDHRYLLVPVLHIAYFSSSLKEYNPSGKADPRLPGSWGSMPNAAPSFLRNVPVSAALTL